MALPSIETTSSFTGNAGSTTPLTLSHTVTSAKWLLVFVMDGNQESTLGVTYSGQNLTNLGSVSGGAGWAHTDIWALQDPPAGTANVSITSSGGWGQVCAVAVGVIGADTTLGTYASWTTASAVNPTLSGIQSAVNALVFACEADDGGGSAGGYSVTSPGVQIFESENHAADSNYGVQYKIGTGATDSVAWTLSDTNGGACISAIAILPGGAPVEERYRTPLYYRLRAA